MRAHEESELLSAYLDGELTAADRTRVDEHLPSCADCRATLGALRATLADLRALPEPDLPGQVSWAVRAAVARERRGLASRYRRWVAVAGGVAAAFVAVLAITVRGGQIADRAATGGAFRAIGVPEVVSTDENYTRDSIAIKLLELSAAEVGVGGQIEPQAAETTAPLPLTEDTAYAARVGRERAGASACDGVIRARSRTTMNLIYAEAALFEGTPAFILVYEVPAGTPERAELWALRRTDCATLYAAQRPL